MTSDGNISKGLVQVRKTGECKWRVSGYVDAQNAFGAMIRSEYSMNVEFRDGRFFARNVKIH